VAKEIAECGQRGFPVIVDVMSREQITDDKLTRSPAALKKRWIVPSCIVSPSLAEKVLYEVEAPASGTLATTLFDEGETVECGAAVAVIAETEDVAAIAASGEFSRSPPSSTERSRSARCFGG
jgi:hypothetical protein